MSAILDMLLAHAAAKPHAPALDGGDGAVVTWSELHGAVSDGARAHALRFDPRRPVALRRDHAPDGAVLELALLAAGIPVLALPGFFTPDQQAHALAASGAQALFDDGHPHGRLLGDHPPVPLPAGTARITFTSGSTGTPKGICLSADHLLTVAQGVVDAVGVGHAGRHLAVLPPGILLETVAGFLATLHAGGTWLCPRQAAIGLGDPFRPDFARLLASIAARRATSLILVPEYLAGLVAAMEASGTRLPELTIVAVGGARTPPELIERARAFGLPVRQGYGLTECGSVVSIEDEAGGEPGSSGRPLGHMRAHVTSDGEIVLDGPLCLGAIGGERAAGLLHTGDLGHIDAAGRIWISGRKSNVIVTGYGRNVSPEWVEAALLARPEILQACVHGDGRPAPEALLVPARPDADLAVAVAAANASLPGYAQVAAWREVAPFTPDNGMLTGNGRLVRPAIAAAWIDAEPSFFLELEAGTLRERMAFLGIAQVRAGLSGEIGIGTYRAYLAQAYHHVRHTVPLLKAARARLGHRTALAAALDDYIAEEDGHDEWILGDIRAAGGHPEAVRASRPAPATEAMVRHAYDRIGTGNPVSLFGMIYVLESVSVALAPRGAAAVAERLGLPPQAFTYLTSHGALDQEHMLFFARLVNGLADPADRAAILTMAREMFGLFGAMFAAIPLEAIDEAA